jgi:hypothetical protein
VGVKGKKQRGIHSPVIRGNVTQKHIEEGVKRDSRHCMVAEAVKEAFPRATSISVDLQTVRLSDLQRGLRFTYLSPRSVQRYIVRFDPGDPVIPFSFTLRGAQISRAGSRDAERVRKARMREKARAARVKQALSEPGTEDVTKRMSPWAQDKLPTRAKIQQETGGVGKDKNELPGTGTVPVRVGGLPPPRIPGGYRREYGLRQLKE